MALLRNIHPGSPFVHCEPHVRPLFDRLVEIVEAIGEVTIIPQKTRIVFQVRVRFIGVYPRKSYLLVGFGFARRRESPRFHKITQYAPRWYTHEMRLASGADFDEEFLEWIRESYAVGEQRLGG